MIKEEFNSEKVRHPERQFFALSPISPPQDPITQIWYYNVYLIQSDAYTIEPQKEQNTFKITLKTAPSLFSFGGKEKITLKTMNNLVFINQWPKGSFNLGAIVLSNQGNVKELGEYLNVNLFSPELDVDSNTFSFLFKPLGFMKENFLSESFSHCTLMIYAQEQNF